MRRAEDCMPSRMKLTSEIYEAWTTFLGSTTTDELWRRTLTAYCHVDTVTTTRWPPPIPLENISLLGSYGTGLHVKVWPWQKLSTTLFVILKSKCLADQPCMLWIVLSPNPFFFLSLLLWTILRQACTNKVRGVFPTYDVIVLFWSRHAPQTRVNATICQSYQYKRAQEVMSILYSITLYFIAIIERIHIKQCRPPFFILYYAERWEKYKQLQPIL